LCGAFFACWMRKATLTTLKQHQLARFFLWFRRSRAPSKYLTLSVLLVGEEQNLDMPGLRNTFTHLTCI